MSWKDSRFSHRNQFLQSPLLASPLVDEPTPAGVIIQTTEFKRLIPERANAPSGERPIGKRIITRNSFEIYEDQMTSLRTLSYQDKMEGQLGSMSGMVRGKQSTIIFRREPQENNANAPTIVLPCVRTPELSNERRHDASNGTMQVSFSMIRTSVCRKLYQSLLQ
jgi:hypothetical protein